MSVYRKRNSPFYHFDFWRGGHRFLGSTGKSARREALIVEAAEKEKAKAFVATLAVGKDAPLTLDLAIGRYWLEAGQHRSNAAALWRDLGRLIEFFGKEKLIADIGDDDAARLVAWRRGQRVERRRKRRAKAKDPLVSPSTVNRSATQVLQRVLTRAEQVWRIPLPAKPRWRQHRLAEPSERVRELRHDEDAALACAFDPDYETLRQFSLASGMRMAETLLTWRQVDFAAGAIITVGKGDKPVRQPMTPRMREILTSRIGHHAEAVFTYVCRRARKAKDKGKERGRGLRYPITASGLKTHWRRRCRRAGVEDYRWHDNRHTFATNLLRVTGNLKLVKRALNHAKIETTDKYAHVLDDELRAGMERAERARTPAQSPAPAPTTAAEPTTKPLRRKANRR